MYQLNDEDTENAEKLNNKQTGTAASGRYIHSFARGGDRTTLGNIYNIYKKKILN